MQIWDELLKENFTVKIKDIYQQAFASAAFMLLRASSTCPATPALTPAARSESRFLQNCHLSTLRGSASQRGPVVNAPASDSPRFGASKLISLKMGPAQWMSHSLATHSSHSVMSVESSSGSSSAFMNCQTGRWSQITAWFLINRAMNEFRFFHLASSSLESSPRSVGSGQAVSGCPSLRR